MGDVKVQQMFLTTIILPCLVFDINYFKDAHALCRSIAWNFFVKELATKFFEGDIEESNFPHKLLTYCNKNQKLRVCMYIRVYIQGKKKNKH
jgi:hypothetical protein